MSSGTRSKSLRVGDVTLNRDPHTRVNTTPAVDFVLISHPGSRAAPRNTFRLLLVLGLACCANSVNSSAEPQAITNKKTLWSAWMSAKSPEDHMRLAAFYRDEAESCGTNRSTKK